MYSQVLWVAIIHLLLAQPPTVSWKQIHFVLVLRHLWKTHCFIRGPSKISDDIWCRAITSLLHLHFSLWPSQHSYHQPSTGHTDQDLLLGNVSAHNQENFCSVSRRHLWTLLNPWAWGPCHEVRPGGKLVREAWRHHIPYFWDYFAWIGVSWKTSFAYNYLPIMRRFLYENSTLLIPKKGKKSLIWQFKFPTQIELSLFISLRLTFTASSLWMKDHTSVGFWRLSTALPKMVIIGEMK